MTVFFKPHRIMMPLLAAFVLGGCAPRPASPPAETGASPAPSASGGTGSPAVAPAPSSSAKGLIEARKAAATGKPAAGPGTVPISRILAHRKDLRLTSDQVARLNDLKRASDQKQQSLVGKITASRRSAKALAIRSSRSGEVSLKSIREGLTSAATADRQLQEERDVVNRQALEILTPAQRGIAHREK